MIRRFVYSICYGDETASSSVTYEDCYVIIMASLYSVFNICPIFMRRWEIQTHTHKQKTYFLRNVTYSMYDVPLSTGWMKYSTVTHLRVADKAGIVLRNVKNIVRKTRTTNGHK